MNIIPISATIGDNIIIKSDNMKWYNGTSLMQYLENIQVNKKIGEKFIIPIQRVCRPNQFFRGFQGNVTSGNIEVGDTIICLPSKESAHIEKLYNLDKEVTEIHCGEAVTLTLDKEIDVSRGCVLTNDNNVYVNNSFNVTMLWMDEEKLKMNSAYYINLGTVSTLCYIRRVNYKIDIDTDEKIIEFETVRKNEIINCDLEVLEKIAVSEFKHNKSLGSLILINRLTHATSSCAIVNKILENKNLFYQSICISSEQRKKALRQNPITIWFTGLSCSGKSTIANELDKILNLNGFHTMLLDGDNIRLGLNRDLSFSDDDRIENIRRIAEVAKLMNEAGLICITAFISPLEINRKMAKRIIGDKFFLVYLNTPLEECEKRDKKGLYEKARKNIIKDFTGINSVFEEPLNPDLILNNNDYQECAKKIFEKIKEKIEL